MAVSRSALFGCRVTLFHHTNVHYFASIRSLSNTFKFQDLEVTKCPPEKLKPKPADNSKLAFGAYFTDHMMEIAWDSKNGWAKPKIVPFHHLNIHPAAKVLHYATELFEGMKAFRSSEGRVNLFRPDMNMKRLLATAQRAGLPTFDGEEFEKCIKKHVSIEADWVPKEESCSLYIRPTFIATEPSLGVALSHQALLYVILAPVGPYYSTGIKPVSLLADPKYVRAWPGGCGDKKMGSNYAPTIALQREAEARGLQQVLWLFGPDHQITEVGAMNLFIFWVNEKGEKELVTAPLNGLILPGVIRQSLLDMTREWKEFKVSERTITMKDVVKALDENRLLEVFGTGTACVVCPVRLIHYEGRDLVIPTMDHKKPLNIRLLNALGDIQYGRVKHKWAVPVN